MRAPAPPLPMSEGQREALEVLARATSAPHRQVQRARALLLAADGVANTHVAAEVGVTSVTVRAWRQRFEVEGLAKFGEVRSGRGPKASIPAETVEAIVHATLHCKPKGQTHWSVRTMAAEFNVSPASVHRIWRALDLKPHRVDTFKVSNDPHFEEKLTDVVGLYLDPRAPRGADDLSGGETFAAGPVAAGTVKLRAAGLGRCRDGWEQP